MVSSKSGRFVSTIDLKTIVINAVVVGHKTRNNFSSMRERLWKVRKASICMKRASHPDSAYGVHKIGIFFRSLCPRFVL